MLAYLDEDGVRATELARLSGRHKQIVGRLVDELEELGYVERRPDPADRRAKLIVPTERGLEQLRLGDEIVAEIEARHAEAIGGRNYAAFRDVLRGVVARDRERTLRRAERIGSGITDHSARISRRCCFPPEPSTESG